MKPNRGLVAFLLAGLALFVSCTPAASAPPIAAAPPSREANDEPLPDTQAGRFLADWLRVVNSGTRDALRRLYETRYDPSLNAPGAIDRRVAVVTKLRSEDGVRHVRKVEQSSEYEITVLLQSENTEVWWRHRVRLDPKPPHLVLEAVGTDIARPAGFDGAGALDDASLKAHLNAYVDKLVSHDLFSGAIAVARRDRVVYERSVGIASRAWNAPMRVDTKMNLGSMNKMFTSVAIAQLVARGKVAYGDTVAKLVPDYPNQDVARRITVHQLLTHSSGLGDYFTDAYERMAKDKLRTVRDYLPLFADAPLLFEPGTRFSYSNAGFMVLGRIVEVASGQDYFSYVREHVYAPAGMNDTDAYAMDHDTPNLAIGYTHLDDDAPGVLANNLYLHVVKGGPAGGGFSTVGDLVKFARALQSGALVDRAKVDLITREQIKDGDAEYGYGFHVAAVRGHGTFGHSGGFSGINGNLTVVPDLGVVVAALANRDPPAADRLATKALDLATQR